MEGGNDMLYADCARKALQLLRMECLLLSEGPCRG